MITYTSGNLLASRAQTLANPVNTVGVMGAGLALAFARAFPAILRPYQEACRTGTLAIGRPWLYRETEPWILHFPTKADWRQPSQLRFIAAGLAAFCDTYATDGITSAAFPALGCGYGGLDWGAVRALMASVLGPLPLSVLVYAPPEGARA